MKMGWSGKNGRIKNNNLLRTNQFVFESKYSIYKGYFPSGCCFNRRKMNPICILASCTKNDIALFSMKRYKCNWKILIMSCITRLDIKPLSWITTWFRLHELLIINFCFNRQCYFVSWTFYYLNIKTYYAYLELPNAIS